LTVCCAPKTCRTFIEQTLEKREMRSSTTAIGKPFAVSLVLICAYSALWIATPPSKVRSDKPAVGVVQQVSTDAPAAVLVMQASANQQPKPLPTAAAEVPADANR